MRIRQGASRGMNNGTRLCATLGISLWASLAAAQSLPPPPAGLSEHQRAIAAGYTALTLCEGVLSAGRTPEQVAATEMQGIYPEYQALASALPARIDPSARRVTVPFDAGLPPRIASWRPLTGCTLAPIGQAEMPGPAPTGDARPIHAVPADPRPWPLGDAGIAPRPGPALAGRIRDALQGGYGGVTTGLVVVRDGRIVGEAYAAGFGPFTPNRTWSVAKSIAGTLTGIAVGDGLLDPAAPAPVPEWRSPGDPRAAITLDQLLRMASGLTSDSAGNRTDAIYFGGTSVTEQAPFWPLGALPGTRFRYANNDILLAIRALRAKLADGDVAGFAATRLLAPLGLRHTTLGADWQGNLVLSSQVWSTARDLARLGELWRGDGVWQGQRLLPAGWMARMTAPSGPQPGSGPGYGATLWLFGPQQGLPAGSFAAQGNRGQYVMVVPARGLVLVRRGEDPAGRGFDIARFTADVLGALAGDGG